MSKPLKPMPINFMTGGDLIWHRAQLFIANWFRIAMIFAFTLAASWFVLVQVFISDWGRDVFFKTQVARLLKTVFVPGYHLKLTTDTGETLRMSAGNIVRFVQENPALNEVIVRVYWLGSIALLIAIAASAIAVYLNIVYGKKAQADEFIRGQKLVEAQDLIKLIGNSSHIQIGGVPIPEQLLARNILCVGSMGTGKTVCIDQIIEDARAWGKKLVIYDKTGQYTSKFYRPDVDVILNACDERCANWSAFADMKEVTDAAMISTFFVQENKNSSDPIWDNAARIVLEDSLSIMREHGKTMNDLRHIVASYSHEELCDLFRKNMDSATASRIISEKNERGTDSVLMTLVAQPAFRFFRFFDKANATFSVREFIRRDDDACLFLTSSPTQHETIKPFISVWLELALTQAMSMGQSVESMRIQFVIDELASLPKLKALDPALTEARQYGISTVIGIQNLSQLDDIYGKDSTHTYVSNLQTKLILRVEDEGSAKRLSDTLGKEEVEEVNESKSFGVESSRDGVNLGTKRTERNLVIASEIMILPDLTGYLKISGAHPIAKVSLSYKHRKAIHPALVNRAGLMLSPVDPTKFEKLVVKRTKPQKPEVMGTEPQKPEVKRSRKVSAHLPPVPELSISDDVQQGIVQIENESGHHVQDLPQAVSTSKPLGTPDPW